MRDSIFTKSEYTTPQLYFGSKKVWLEKDRFLYPTNFREIAEMVVGKLRSPSEDELN